MGRLETLLYYIKQMEISAQEMRESVNERDKKARFSEVLGYHRRIESILERHQNEAFRTDPKSGLRRALLRWSQESRDDLPNPQ